MTTLAELYVGHAAEHIRKCVQSNTRDQISRTECELTILRDLDQAKFPVEYRMAFYYSILSTDIFNSFWIGAKLEHSLPDTCIARLTPDLRLCDISPSGPNLRSRRSSARHAPSSKRMRLRRRPRGSRTKSAKRSTPPSTPPRSRSARSSPTEVASSSSFSPEEVWYGSAAEEHREETVVKAQLRAAKAKRSAERARAREEKEELREEHAMKKEQLREDGEKMRAEHAVMKEVERTRARRVAWDMANKELLKEGKVGGMEPGVGAGMHFLKEKSAAAAGVEQGSADAGTITAGEEDVIGGGNRCVLRFSAGRTPEG